MVGFSFWGFPFGILLVGRFKGIKNFVFKVEACTFGREKAFRGRLHRCKYIVTGMMGNFGLRLNYIDAEVMQFALIIK